MVDDIKMFYLFLFCICYLFVVLFFLFENNLFVEEFIVLVIFKIYGIKNYVFVVI